MTVRSTSALYALIQNAICSSRDNESIDAAAMRLT